MTLEGARGSSGFIASVGTADEKYGQESLWPKLGVYLSVALCPGTEGTINIFLLDCYTLLYVELLLMMTRKLQH